MEARLKQSATRDALNGEDKEGGWIRVGVRVRPPDKRRGAADGISVDSRNGAIVARGTSFRASLGAQLLALDADGRARLEENALLRSLARRLGATPKELECVRRSQHLATHVGPAGAGGAKHEAEEAAEDVRPTRARGGGTSKTKNGH